MSESEGADSLIVTDNEHEGLFFSLGVDTSLARPAFRAQPYRQWKNACGAESNNSSSHSPSSGRKQRSQQERYTETAGIKQQSSMPLRPEPPPWPPPGIAKDGRGQGARNDRHNRECNSIQQQSERERFTRMVAERPFPLSNNKSDSSEESEMLVAGRSNKNDSSPEPNKYESKSVPSSTDESEPSTAGRFQKRKKSEQRPPRKRTAGRFQKRKKSEERPPRKRHAVGPTDAPSTAGPFRNRSIRVNVYTGGWKTMRITNPLFCRHRGDELRSKAEHGMQREFGNENFHLSYVYDCTIFKNPISWLKRHWGEHIGIMEGVLGMPETESVFADVAGDLAKVPCGQSINILFLCNTGRHRSIAMAKFFEYILQKEGILGHRVEHIWPGSDVDFCTRCSECGEWSDPERRQLQYAAFKMWEKIEARVNS